MKLDEEKVREIRALRGLLPHRLIAERFGVSIGCVSHVDVEAHM